MLCARRIAKHENLENSGKHTNPRGEAVAEPEHIRCTSAAAIKQHGYSHAESQSLRQWRPPSHRNSHGAERAAGTYSLRVLTRGRALLRRTLLRRTSAASHSAASHSAYTLLRRTPRCLCRSTVTAAVASKCPWRGEGGGRQLEERSYSRPSSPASHSAATHASMAGHHRGPPRRSPRRRCSPLRFVLAPLSPRHVPMETTPRGELGA